MNQPARHPRALALLLAALLLAPAAARAANKADAFEGKIRPVSGQLYGKAGRFELTPTLATKTVWMVAGTETMGWSG